MNSKAESSLKLKVFKSVRTPGSVKFLWDYRLIMLGVLGMGIVPLVSVVFEPIEGYEEFLNTWGFEFFTVIFVVLLAVMCLKMQGIIHVNQTESKIEILK